MNVSKNSLCATCEHLIYCKLTNDKTFIFSCSEYEPSGHVRMSILPTGTDDFLASDNQMTVV